MTIDSENTTETPIHRDQRFIEIFELIQWLLIALILALFFRAFIMEAYRIPSGSMANSLRGAHFRLCCSKCGYRYDRGFESMEYQLAKDTLPASGKAAPYMCRCPSCGYDLEFEEPQWITNGDRILVLKSPYQFFSPKRWDVVVFRKPTNPASNMIKRLVGKPGETVTIIDGDIYIDGKIARKGKKLQEQLWMVVYDNDHQPVRVDGELFNDMPWRQLWRNEEGSSWRFRENGKAKFVLESENEKLNWLGYDGDTGNGLRANYAYNGSSFHDVRPYCSDLKVSFNAASDWLDIVGAELSKYGIRYRGWVDEEEILIGQSDANEIQILCREKLKDSDEKYREVSFAIVDHQLVMSVNGQSVRYDMGKDPNDAGPRQPRIKPTVRLFGRGGLELSHIAIYRDIHYTESDFVGSSRTGRASEGKAFTLGEDEYFVLGDNTINSHDGRWWYRPGSGNNGKQYRAGIVPRDYLVGKAIYVYWPSGYRPFKNSRIAFVPNIRQMRFIYGGN